MGAGVDGRSYPDQQGHAELDGADDPDHRRAQEDDVDAEADL